MQYYNNRKDLNHAETVKLFHAFGAVCYDVDTALGIDLLVGFRGRWILVEIKSARGRETKRQTRMRETCERLGLPYFTHREGEPISKILDQIK
jgi:hypothetical protein